MPMNHDQWLMSGSGGPNDDEYVPDDEGEMLIHMQDKPVAKLATNHDTFYTLDITNDRLETVTLFFDTADDLIQFGENASRLGREAAGRKECESAVGGEPTLEGPATPIIACKPHPAELVEMHESS